MSSRPVDNNDLSAGIGLLICGFIFFTKFTCALVSFLALLQTILALMAWNRRLQIGSIVVEPYEARAFILGGLAGALIVPLFMVFATIFFDIRFNWHGYGLYLIVGGYVAGSVGIEFLNGDKEKPTQQSPVAMLAPPSKAPPDLSNFHFADWDDGERRG